MSVLCPGNQVPAGRPASGEDAETSRNGADWVTVRPRPRQGGPCTGFALLLSLSMAQFMVVLDFTIVNVALPSIQRDLHVAITTLQWLVRAYAVAFGGFLLLGGRLADACGRARLYRIGLVVFVAASISRGLAVGPDLLIASRAVQGIGAALLTPAGLSRWSPAGQRAADRHPAVRLGSGHRHRVREAGR